MRCLHCQGQMERGETTFHLDRNDCHLTLDRVSAWVCRQCGETFFETPEVDLIQELIGTIDQTTEALRKTA